MSEELTVKGNHLPTNKESRQVPQGSLIWRPPPYCQSRKVLCAATYAATYAATDLRLESVSPLG